MKKLLIYALGIAIIGLILVSCGGGGGSSPSSTSTTYTSAAQVGEVVSFQVTKDGSGNPTSYSYTITKSAFGCDSPTAPCHTGSGTLTANTDGTYSMSQFPSSRLHILQNGLIFGAVQVPINGVNIAVPIVGMQQPATSPTDFADAGGTYYNWLELQCTTPGGVNGACTTKIGSALIMQDGTWTSCHGYNLADTTGGVNSGNSTNCVYGNNESKGKVVSNGDGTWILQGTNDNGTSYFNVGLFIAFKDPSSGQRVAIFDINDGTHGWGYGEIVASSQVTLTAAEAEPATWNANQYWPTSTVKTAKITVNTTADASNPSTVFDMSGTGVWSGGSNSFSGTGTINSVNLSGRGAGTWNGFVTPSTDSSEVDLMAGSGFFMGVAGIDGYGSSGTMIETGWKK